MCKVASMSRSHLYQEFKKLGGTYLALQQYLRIEYVANRLIAEELMSQVCFYWVIKLKPF